jgi:DNA-binding beta-propeller fold protein YncE
MNTDQICFPCYRKVWSCSCAAATLKTTTFDERKDGRVMEKSSDESASRTAITVILILVTAIAVYAAQPQSASKPGTVTTVSSTVPSNGDINPYGVFRIPQTVGRLERGNILVSNFNNSGNLQGTGTTLVQIAPDGTFSLFAQIDPNHLPGPCPGGVGLTTALVVLRSGWVIVGSLPTTDGLADTAQAGCLLVLDSNGNVTETITDAQINGPWDMTVSDGTGEEEDRGEEGHHNSDAALFVTNVLNGTVAGGGKIVNQGTVIRVALSVRRESAPSVKSITVIGSGFPERTDPLALVLGPTGVALSKNHKTLYVADSLNNRIAAISDPLTRQSSANTGSTLSIGGALNDPLGMTVATNGDVLTVNGNDGNMVVTKPNGEQSATILLDPAGAGVLFGLTDVREQGVYFVDDGTNTLDLFRESHD